MLRKSMRLVCAVNYENRKLSEDIAQLSYYPFKYTGKQKEKHRGIVQK
jgi:hypothetical protein